MYSAPEVPGGQGRPGDLLVPVGHLHDGAAGGGLLPALQGGEGRAGQADVSSRSGQPSRGGSSPLSGWMGRLP